MGSVKDKIGSGAHTAAPAAVAAAALLCRCSSCTLPPAACRRGGLPPAWPPACRAAAHAAVALCSHHSTCAPAVATAAAAAAATLCAAPRPLLPANCACYARAFPANSSQLAHPLPPLTHLNATLPRLHPACLQSGAAARSRRLRWRCQVAQERLSMCASRLRATAAPPLASLAGMPPTPGEWEERPVHAVGLGWREWLLPRPACCQPACRCLPAACPPLPSARCTEGPGCELLAWLRLF
jgi:hypothetical protein